MTAVCFVLLRFMLTEGIFVPVRSSVIADFDFLFFFFAVDLP
jgi:hypothetical protein